MHKFEIEYFGKPLSIETGKLAKQAGGSVLVRYGNTMVLVTATAAKSNKNTIGYFPLTCMYQFKAYAGGKIPGGFLKREARPSDSETLTSRMIDRPIRPLFPKEYQAETQVIATVISYDEDSPPEVAAILGASAALAISDIPFKKHIAAAAIGFDGQNYTLNQSAKELENGKLNLLLVSSKDAIVMVESKAKEISEEQMLKALSFGREAIAPLISLQEKLVKAVAPKKRTVESQSLPDGLEDDITQLIKEPIKKALTIKTKKERYDVLDEALDLVIEKYPDEYASYKDQITEVLANIRSDILRGDILAGKGRVDGRKPDEIRPISCETGILPNAHGSALFTRGETQVLAVATLGAKEDEQIIDGPGEKYYKKFYLHYNFPPYSVGEVSRLGPPGRREIGHGRLAERSLAQLLPDPTQFPYTIRVVAEVLESNGSSSMASVCGSSLALENCEVPLAAPVAGIAMGLVYEDSGKAVILSDILGDEDYIGDMDFKVAGTKKGITGLQMDIKIDGLTDELFEQSLIQAKAGRLHILEEMAKATHNKRDVKISNIPKYLQFKIPVSKIRRVIGAGGQTIKGITAKSGAKVDVNDNGLINITSTDQKKAELALALIQQAIGMLQIGQTYKGTIKGRIGLGFFVECLPGLDGLVPIKEFDAPDKYKEGQSLVVKVAGYDKQDRLQLTLVKN